MSEQKGSLAEAANLLYLDASNTSFKESEGGMLSVTVSGTLYPVVFVHCSFPHTNRFEYLSIRDLDNKEMGMVRKLDDFDSDTVALLKHHIQIRYFAPVITRIVKVVEEFGYSYWHAETTAGDCRFTVRAGGKQLVPVTAVQIMVTDVDGNRFIIPDYNKLSDKEYRMIETLM